MDTQARIFNDQVALLYRQAWPGFLGTGVNAVILALVFWPYSPRPLLLGWLILIFAIIAARAMLVWRYHRQPVSTSTPENHARRWHRRYIVGAALGGICWGLAGSLLFPEQHHLQQTVLAITLAGMAAGAVPLLSSAPGVYPFYLLPTLLPFAVWTGLHSQPELRVVGLLTIVFTLVLLQASRYTRESLHESLRLKYENADLVQNLSATKRNVEELNRTLGQEVTGHKAAQRRLQAIFDNASEGIVILDADGRVDSLNQAASRIFGHTDESLRQQDGCQSLFSRTDRSEDCYRHLLSPDDSVMAHFVEVLGKRRDGTTFPMEITASRVDIDDRRLFIWMVRDITERKALERMKNEFVSTVSHELRTPLTAIRGALSLIAQGVTGPQSEQQKQLVDIAANNSERLLRLINDILDIEKIESGKLNFRIQPLFANELAQQALTMNQTYADQHQVQFRLEALAEDVRFEADADRLLQVLTNLLSNAAKFSPRNTAVTLAIQATTNEVRYSVSDSGPGIAADYQPHIFEKFSQGDSSDARQRGGTGLGLSISKALVEQMGGRIGFETWPGQGTRFDVSFPRQHPLAR